MSETTAISYTELKEHIFLKHTLKYPISNEIKYFEHKVSKIIKTQKKRVKLDACLDRIIIDVTRNRDVAITLSELHELQELFEATELVVSSPLRCKLIIEILREEEDEP